MRPRVAASGVVALARKPRLWPTAWAEYRALVDPKWRSKWPWLPLPARRYMSFRAEAMYGPERAVLSASELVAYLEWCRWMRALAR
jgi:hypothetical protein